MQREVNVDFSTIFRLAKPAFFSYFFSVQFSVIAPEEDRSDQPKYSTKSTLPSRCSGSCFLLGFKNKKLPTPTNR